MAQWWREVKIPNETPEQRERALREALEEIWIQGKDRGTSSIPWRMAYKAEKTLKLLYGEKPYENIS
ncbi:hypothetical protein [Paenibacillus bouchesdurhonensis]|uniref:hypothetical protein n=1 Tax=Paenibacillus bouchesdurhonensis TaxID=1870990 RepID=UPI000DA62391|nr:hypothetical protein [Paenibacillus bouchesdurhonensis]